MSGSRRNGWTLAIESRLVLAEEPAGRLALAGESP